MRDRELSPSPGATQLGGVRAIARPIPVHLQEKHGEMHKAPEWVFFLCAIRFGGFSVMSLYITLENEKKKKKTGQNLNP